MTEKTKTERTTGSIVADAELKAIASIVKQLNALDDDARARTLGYLWQRFGTPASAACPAAGGRP